MEVEAEPKKPVAEMVIQFCESRSAMTTETNAVVRPIHPEAIGNSRDENERRMDAASARQTLEDLDHGLMQDAVTTVISCFRVRGSDQYLLSGPSLRCHANRYSQSPPDHLGQQRKIPIRSRTIFPHQIRLR
jgi:hypothetical protein